MAQRGMQEWNPKWTRIDVTQENKTKKKLASGMTTSKKKKEKKKGFHLLRGSELETKRARG